MNGKIYKIASPCHHLVYVGSTIQTLKQRLKKHESCYKQYLKNNYAYMTSFEILKKNCYEIILLEEILCNDRTELYKRERYYIEKNNCCNKYIPSKNNKEYYQDNIEKIKEQKNKQFFCPCGGRFTRTNKSHHEHTIKHLIYLESIKR